MTHSLQSTFTENVRRTNRGECLYYFDKKGKPSKYHKFSLIIDGYSQWGSVNVYGHHVSALLAFRQQCPEATIGDQVLLAGSKGMEASHRCRVMVKSTTFAGREISSVKETCCLLREHLIWEEKALNEGRKQCQDGPTCSHHPMCILVQTG